MTKHISFTGGRRAARGVDFNLIFVAVPIIIITFLGGAELEVQVRGDRPQRWHLLSSEWRGFCGGMVTVFAQIIFGVTLASHWRP
jgi:hypothetical protein